MLLESQSGVANMVGGLRERTVSMVSLGSMPCR
jgi:hypothetical protein